MTVRTRRVLYNRDKANSSNSFWLLLCGERTVLEDVGQGKPGRGGGSWGCLSVVWQAGGCHLDFTLNDFESTLKVRVTLSVEGGHSSGKSCVRLYSGHWPLGNWHPALHHREQCLPPLDPRQLGLCRQLQLAWEELSSRRPLQLDDLGQPGSNRKLKDLDTDYHKEDEHGVLTPAGLAELAAIHKEVAELKTGTSSLTWDDVCLQVGDQVCCNVTSSWYSCCTAIYSKSTFSEKFVAHVWSFQGGTSMPRRWMSPVPWFFKMCLPTISTVVRLLPRAMVWIHTGGIKIEKIALFTISSQDSTRFACLEPSLLEIWGFDFDYAK